MNYTNLSFKLRLIAFGLASIYLASCKNVDSSDQTKNQVISSAKKYLADSLKIVSPEAFSNFTAITEYDSVLMSIKYAAAQSRETQIDKEALLSKKEMMDKLTPMYAMINQTDQAHKHMVNAYSNVNSGLSNDSNTLQLYSQGREICINKLKDKSLQNKIAGYKIICICRDSNSRVSIWELTLDPHFKVTSKSEL